MLQVASHQQRSFGSKTCRERDGSPNKAEMGSSPGDFPSGVEGERITARWVKHSWPQRTETRG